MPGSNEPQGAQGEARAAGDKFGRDAARAKFCLEFGEVIGGHVCRIADDPAPRRKAGNEQDIDQEVAKVRVLGP